MGGSKVQFVPSGRGIQVHFVTNKMGGGGKGESNIVYSQWGAGWKSGTKYNRLFKSALNRVFSKFKNLLYFTALYPKMKTASAILQSPFILLSEML